MFVDEITIYARAGKGGDGVVRWRHEKGKEYSGPSGGNGGRGGDVIARAVRDLNVFSAYRHKKEFLAKCGVDGMKDSREGKNGDDLVIDVPIGTIITNKKNGAISELLVEGEKHVLLKGGKGGLGNEHFKGPKNTRPSECTAGAEGEDADFFMEVRLVVDAGLVGLPNAGKSSLLNMLTRARHKVADYPFTTLAPGLGVLYGYVLADIPGIIRGAASGKGLGHTFLRHINRARVLLHCVSLENEDIMEAYKTIRGELEMYDSELAAKREIIILTKSDIVSEKEAISAVAKMEDVNKNIFVVSIYDDGSIKILSDYLVSELVS